MHAARPRATIGLPRSAAPAVATRNGAGRPVLAAASSSALTYARSACSVSLVTSPCQTSSHNASTVSPGKPPPRAFVKRGEERGAVSLQIRERSPPIVLRPSLAAGGRRPQAWHVVGEIKRDAAVSFAERLDADPDDLARGHQRVEHRRLIVCDARRQDISLEDRGGERRALQLLDRVEQRLEAATHASRCRATRRETVRARRRRPARLRCRSRASERRRRRAQHVGVDPFALDCRRAGTRLARAAPLPSAAAAATRRSPCRGRSVAASSRAVNGRMRSSESQREIAGRVADRLEQRLRECPAGSGVPKRVAVSGGVFDGDDRAARQRSAQR